MTNVLVLVDKRILQVKIKGHAGYANSGEDIVCAGISSLAFAAGIALTRYNIPAKIDEDEKQAALIIAPQWSLMNEEEIIRCETILNTLVWAIEDLEKSYRQYVKLEIRHS